MAGLACLLSGCFSSGMNPLDADVAGTTGSIAPAAEVGVSSHETAQEQPFPFSVEEEGKGPSGAPLSYSEDAAGTAPEEKLALLRPVPSAKPQSGRAKPTVYKASFGDAKPIKFDHHLHPKHFQVHGVDVSRWQGDIDWKKLRVQGGNFAFIKATEGDDHMDPSFQRYWKEARAAGIPRGAYHFFYWCSLASHQADWFIQNVPKEAGALPPVIDVEWNSHSRTCRKRPSREVVLEKMRVFMEKLEAHYGQKPIIYTAPDFYEDNLKGEFKDYPFWLRSVADHPRNVYGDRDWIFWQYTGTGRAKGVDHHIDLNVFNGSKAGWHKWLARETL